MFHGCLSNFAFPLSSKAHPRPRSMKKTWIQAIRDKRGYLIVDLSKLVEAVDESVLYIYIRESNLQVNSILYRYFFSLLGLGYCFLVIYRKYIYFI